jgi:tetratricopeptide (TPR) repeat protein
MGTLRYMAPEQMEGSHRVDHRADIYSLGATVFRIVMGRHPFKNPGEIGNAGHRAAQELALSESIGAPLAGAIMKAIEHDTDRRYSDVKEFGCALEQALERPTGPLKLSADVPAPTMEERLEEASATVRGGNTDGSAEARYQAIIADYPNQARPYLDYARFCAAYRTHAETIRVLTAGIDVAGANADLHFQRGRIYRAVGKVNDAITDLKEALRIGLDAEKIAQAERLLARLQESGTVSRA